MAENFTDYGNYSQEFLTLLRTDEAWDLARAQGSPFSFAFLLQSVGNKKFIFLQSEAG